MALGAQYETASRQDVAYPLRTGAIENGDNEAVSERVRRNRITVLDTGASADVSHNRVRAGAFAGDSEKDAVGDTLDRVASGVVGHVALLKYLGLGRADSGLLAFVELSQQLDHTYREGIPRPCRNRPSGLKRPLNGGGQ